MDAKGLVIIILIVAIVTTLIVGGYFILSNKSIVLPPSGNTNSTSSINQATKLVSIGPIGITLTSDCEVAGSKGDVDPSTKNVGGPNGYVLKDGEWLINCGSNNNNARGTLGPVLEQQGWKFCNSQTATGRWWKDGTITVVIESAGASYPFRVTQQNGADCSSN